MRYIFSSRLTKLRTQTGLSQKQLAGNLKISLGSMSNYENGIYLPPLEKATAMAFELHTSLDYLTGLTDVNLDPDFLTKPISKKITFAHLIKLLCSLEQKDMEEILKYADYLKYKKKRSVYMDEPRTLSVAEETSIDL